MPDETKLYRVTDAGGPRPDVAGKRRRVNDELSLTPAQAEFEVSRGMIAEVLAEAETAPVSVPETPADPETSTASRSAKEK